MGDAVLLQNAVDNHVMMVQRMIGNKFGTGGSSGYQYLRATVRLVNTNIAIGKLIAGLSMSSRHRELNSVIQCHVIQ